MKKLIKTFIISILILTSSNSFSQDFFHKIGFQYSYFYLAQEYTYELNGNPNVTGETFELSSIPGFMYQFGLNLELANNINFRPTSYAFLNLSMSSVYGISVGIEVPVLGELYFGDLERTGGFINAGYSFGYYGGFLVHGPQSNIGIHFVPSRGFFEDQGVTIKLGYTHPLNKFDEIEGNTYTKTTSMVISLGFLVDF